VIRNVKAQTYDGAVQKQVEEVKAKSKFKCVDDLLKSGTTWEV
jgi:2-oxoglutarate ferredoxin oxidoreductase subunit beta